MVNDCSPESEHGARSGRFPLLSLRVLCANVISEGTGLFGTLYSGPTNSCSSRPLVFCGGQAAFAGAALLVYEKLHLPALL